MLTRPRRGMLVPSGPALWPRILHGLVQHLGGGCILSRCISWPAIRGRSPSGARRGELQQEEEEAQEQEGATEGASIARMKGCRCAGSTSAVVDNARNPILPRLTPGISRVWQPEAAVGAGQQAVDAQQGAWWLLSCWNDPAWVGCSPHPGSASWLASCCGASRRATGVLQPTHALCGEVELQDDPRCARSRPTASYYSPPPPHLSYFFS